MGREGRTILAANALSGTLDLISAFVFSGMNGGTPDRVMASVASGPFGDGMRGNGITGVIVGTLVHYSIMAVMVTVFVLAARAYPMLRRQWLAAGIIYGV